MSEPAKSNTGVIVAVIAGALIVVGGIFLNTHLQETRGEERTVQAARDAKMDAYREQYEGAIKQFAGYVNGTPSIDDRESVKNQLLEAIKALNADLDNTHVTVDNLKEVNQKRQWRDDLNERLKALF